MKNQLKNRFNDFILYLYKIFLCNLSKFAYDISFDISNYELCLYIQLCLDILNVNMSS